MKSLRLTILSFFLAFSVLISGCQSWSHTAKKGTIGAAAGGALGAVIGKATGNTATGAIIGAAVGGTAGALIGRRMDRQAAEMRNDLKNAKIERVGEGIKVTFNSGILFDVGSANLKPAAKANIKDLVQILQKYSDTDVMVFGHTDNTGGEELNQNLSEKRASSVSKYATALGANPSRFSTVGLGESQPVADNSTSAGRSANRRVELAIFANEKLQRAAKRGDVPVD